MGLNHNLYHLILTNKVHDKQKTKKTTKTIDKTESIVSLMKHKEY